MLSPLLLLGMVMALGLWALDGIHAGGPWEQVRPFLPLRGNGGWWPPVCGAAPGGAAWAGLPWAWDCRPLLIVAGGLLLSADQAFYDFFEALPAACGHAHRGGGQGGAFAAHCVYLCCFYLQAEREKTPALRPQREGDPVVLGVMLGLYCGLYLLFLVISCRALAGNASPRRRAGAVQRLCPARVFPAVRGAAVLNLAFSWGYGGSAARDVALPRGADPAGGADPVPYCPGADKNAALYPPVRPDAAAAVYQLHDGWRWQVLFLALMFPCTGPYLCCGWSGAGGLHPGGGGG